MLDCAKPGVWSTAGVVGCIVSPRSATDSRAGRVNVFSQSGFTVPVMPHMPLCRKFLNRLDDVNQSSSAQGSQTISMVHLSPFLRASPNPTCLASHP